MILPDAEKSIPNATAACDVEVEAVEEDNLELAIVILPDAQKMMLRSDRTSLVSVLKSGTSEEDPEKRLVSESREQNISKNKKIEVEATTKDDKKHEKILDRALKFTVPGTRIDVKKNVGNKGDHQNHTLELAPPPPPPRGCKGVQEIFGRTTHW